MTSAARLLRIQMGPVRRLVKIDHHPAQWGTDTLRTQQSLDFCLRGNDSTVAGGPLRSS